MEQNFVPFIPENAPFSSEQRAFLNGLLAGLFSRAGLASLPNAATPPARALRPLTILFGSQTGNAEAIARKAAAAAGKHGFAPVAIEMAQYAKDSLQKEECLLIITST